MDSTLFYSLSWSFFTILALIRLLSARKVVEFLIFWLRSWSVEMPRLARCGFEGGHSAILASTHACLQRRPFQFKLSFGVKLILWDKIDLPQLDS